MAAAEEAKSELPPMAKIRLVSYSTERRAKSPNDDEDWEPSMTIAFGTDNTDLMHAIVSAMSPTHRVLGTINNTHLIRSMPETMISLDLSARAAKGKNL